MSSRLRTRFAREDGIALPMVLLAVVLIGGIVVLMFATARFELRATASARDFEAAIHAADGGMEHLFASFLDDEALPESMDAGYACDPDAGANEWDWVFDEDADRIPPQSDWTDTEVGWSYGVGPFECGDEVIVYGVGITGDPADPNAIRVARATLRTELEETDGGSTTANFGEYAILTNGNLGFTNGGNTSINPPAPIHANGNFGPIDNPLATSPSLNAPGANPISATGSITSTNWHFNNNANLTRELLPGADPVGVEEIRAEWVWNAYAQDADEWYDLCPAGSIGEVREPSSNPDAGPCEGPLVTQVTGSWPTQVWEGWEWISSSNTWRKTWGNPHPTGVMYAHHSNIQVQNFQGQADQRRSLIASAAFSGDTPTTGGSINVPGAVNVFHSMDVGNLALFADRDIYSTGGTLYFDGVIYAREQMDLGANTNSPLPSGAKGRVVIYDAPHTPSSPVSVNRINNVLNMHPDANYTFDFDPGDGSGDGPPILSSLQVVSWEELTH